MTETSLAAAPKVCSRSRGAAMATDVLPDDKLTEDRPFWLPGPCPDWCTRDHQPGDVDQERHHADTGVTVHLSLHDGWGRLWEAQPLHIGLFQNPREVEAYVEVYWPPRDAVIKLTVAEAESLASSVSAAVANARAATPTRKPQEATA